MDSIVCFVEEEEEEGCCDCYLSVKKDCADTLMMPVIVQWV